MAHWWSASGAASFAYHLTKSCLLYGFPAACTLHTVFNYVGEITPTSGPSMLPTLNLHGDWLIISRLGNWRKRLVAGDVVVFASPLEPERRAVKTILGMPGDIVCFDPTVKNLEYIKVPRGHVWLQGDNHSNSTDSRVYGPIPLGIVSGKVVATFWPTWSIIKNRFETVPGTFKK